MSVLVFTGGRGPCPETVGKILLEVLGIEKNPSVIAADSGLEYFLSVQKSCPELDLELDFCLGDFDSIGDSSLLGDIPSEKIIRHNPYKDFTDTELALEKAGEIMLSNPSEREIILFGGGGGREDHFLGIFDCFSGANHPDFWYTENSQFVLMKSLSRYEISGINEADTVSFARTTSSYQGGKIHSEGLEWEGPVFRQKGIFSLSNRIRPGAEVISVMPELTDCVAILPLLAKVQQTECR